MEILTQRQQNILEKLVSGYIKMAVPISSDFLKEEGCFDCSPATLRIDLAELTELGFLEKPYASGGRVPTDMGYRFFVDSFVQKEQPSTNKQSEKFSSILEHVKNTIEASQKIAGLVADLTDGFSLVKLDPENIFLKDGWEEILQEPEFQDISFVRDFASFVDDFEDFISQTINEDGVKVFIGNEMPFKKKGFSAIIGRAGEESIFAILGPKRMDFKKNIRLMNNLIETYERTK